MSDPEIVVDALRWLRYAKEDLDLAAAIAHAGDRTPRHACFLAQQAAEKGLKAVLVLEHMVSSRSFTISANCGDSSLMDGLSRPGWPTSRS